MKSQNMKNNKIYKKYFHISVNFTHAEQTLGVMIVDSRLQYFI